MPGRLFCFLFLLCLCAGSAHAGSLPEGFSYISEVAPTIVIDARYYTDNNFIGDPVDGYLAPRAILTTRAAQALAKAQGELEPFGLSIKVFDGYRPQQAVDHFVRWGKDLADSRQKSHYYPDVQKKDLFRDGYIAEKSGHTRGSTVDVTIIDSATGKELDMGTPFDFFGPKSWPGNKSMPSQVRANRALLQSVMVRHGFKPYEAEWWHFTLKDEPYPDTYFEFPVQ